MVAPFVNQDKEWWSDDLAARAAQAGNRHDRTSVYSILRALRSPKARHHPAIHDESGKRLLLQEDIDSRWRRYWADLVCGEVCNVSSLNQVPPQQYHDPHLHDIITPLRTYSTPSNLRNSLGPDRLSLATWVLWHLHAHCHVEQHHKAPVGLRSGRMQEPFKKWSRLQTNNYRGLLIQNHLGKIHGQTHKVVVAATRNLMFPRQVEAIISYSHASDLSWCVLFIDVVKAFEKVVRQLSMGKPNWLLT